MSGTRHGSISIAIPEEGVLAGAGRERWARVELEDFFWIGRCSICNLRIQGDTQVSRLQATIHREDDGYLLTDMQSRNGTSVNGRRVNAIRLVPGDRVKVGQTLFEFEPDNKQDTFFHQGTSRHVGDADLELKSFPCSINLSEAPGFVMQVVNEPAPGTPPPAPVAPRVMPRARSLEAFLTIVVDRIVCELQATLGLVFLPPVGAREALTVARGMRDGKLEVLETPWDVVRRVSGAFTPPPAGEPPPEDGERLLWLRDGTFRRIAPAEHHPRGLDMHMSYSIALPRVGRTGVAEPTNGLAWIHVQQAGYATRLARLVEEVASAVNVSVIRFLERGSA